nr:MAG: hypothetical protein [Tombusviridae sp.]
MEQTWNRVPTASGHPKRGGSLATASPRAKAGKATSSRLPTGNAKGQSNQQALTRKHRWSMEDVQRATDKTLQQRVLLLQSTVEELRRRLNSTSNGKSVGAIRHTGKAPHSGRNGRSAPDLRPQSSVRLTKSTVSLPAGMKDKVAPNVIRAHTARDKPTVKPVQGGDGRPKLSFATVAKFSPPQTLVGGQPANKLPESDSLPVKRGLPPVKGASRNATLSAGPVRSNDDPIFAPAMSPQCTSRPSKSEVRAVRKAHFVVTEPELTDYLHFKFLHVERTAKTPIKMKNEAENYLRKFDKQRTDWRELAVMVSRAIQAAMIPLDESVLLRNSFKDDAKLHEMEKHTKFVNEGKVGKKGIFGFSKSLPKST